MIRQYQEKDRENVRHVCHATATAPAYVKSKELVCLLYCDYYLDNEAEHCFVVTDDNDNAVGYILCALDQDKYEKDFEPYRAKAKKISFFDGVACKIEDGLFKKLFHEYPAHLHIDILPDYQGGGNGTRLMTALLEHLKSIGVSGIHLGVGAGNKRAQKFYEKNGFEKLGSVPAMTMIYCKKLN